MNKYTIRWVIALLSLALFGLLCVQLYWVNNAVGMKRELFRQSVNGAMSAVISKLEKREVASAVAQTVYAANMQADTMQAMPPEPAQPTPEPVPVPVEAPTSPVASHSGSRLATTITTLHRTPVASGQGTLNTVPIVVSGSQRPSGMYNAISAQGTGTRTRTNQTFGIIDRSATPIHLIHLDSMCNTMHLYLDTSITRQQEFLTQRRSAPRITVRNKNNNRTQQVTVRTQWEQDTAAMQWQESARAFSHTMEFNVNIPELEQRIEHIQTMVTEMFEEPIFVELNEPSPPPSQVWMCEQDHNHAVQDCYSIHAATHQAKRAKLSAGTGASKVATADAPARKQPHGQKPAVRSESTTVAVADNQRSDRDKLVSIKDMASRVVTELATGIRPISQRVSSDLLDSLLRSELAQRGVTLPYHYAVLSQHNAFALATPASYNTELKQSAFRAALYPNDIIAEPYFLSIYFPNQDEFVYESMWGVLGTSMLFILLILGCFSFTLVTLTRQKKLSDMKTDFINNMTHELKTPIATISLASEALRDPAVRGSDNRVMRFINAIYEENRRLGSQVERVLQAAVIDRGEVRISPSTVCVHDILKQALQTIAIQVESRGGTVQCQFDAGRDCIQADRVHLTNIIINLLDNANKYSPDSPRIALITTNTNNGITISVEDNGIGMSRDAQKRIFEQFYRVSTGNLHDVKGFGLGLSYVKAMVEAHGGTITVRSEPRQGSRFDLFFPFAGKEAVHA